MAINLLQWGPMKLYIRFLGIIARLLLDPSVMNETKWLNYSGYQYGSVLV